MKPGKIEYEKCIGHQYKENTKQTMAIVYDNGYCGHLGHDRRHIRVSDLRIAQSERRPRETEVNLKELNILIPRNNGWYINQTDCRYIHIPDNNGSSITHETLSITT